MGISGATRLYNIYFVLDLQMSQFLFIYKWTFFRFFLFSPTPARKIFNSTHGLWEIRYFTDFNLFNLKWRSISFLAAITPKFTIKNVHFVITYECANSTTAYLVAIGLVFLHPNYRII